MLFNTMTIGMMGAVLILATAAMVSVHKNRTGVFILSMLGFCVALALLGLSVAGSAAGFPELIGKLIGYAL